jgi:ATP-dependent helicase HrpB
MDFPVDQIIPALSEALGNGPAALLVAEPGAGKTTRVPLKLLDAAMAQGTEDRDAGAAPPCCPQRRPPHGGDAGRGGGRHRRLHRAPRRRVSARTRIEVVTEGILTRRLQQDPELSGTGLVIFDEFHERSLDADLGLALTLDIQRGFATI